MSNSDIAVYYKELNYYEDMTKFAKLAIWLAGDEQTKVSDLMGDCPVLNKQEKRRELNQQDEEIINFAKENGLKYKVTDKGVKIVL